MAIAISTPEASASLARCGLDVDATYRRHAGFVWANLRRFGVPADALEDAVHDVFVVVHRHAARFDPQRASVTTWLFGILRRVAADIRRRHDRRQGGLDTYRRHRASDRAEPRPHVPTTAELRVILADLLATIDDDAATIFVLSQLHGVPLSRIAADLGLNRNTAASRLRATRRRFARLLGAPSADRAIAALEDDAGDMPEDARRRVLAGLAPVVSIAKGSASLSTWLGLALASSVAVMALTSKPATQGTSTEPVAMLLPDVEPALAEPVGPTIPFVESRPLPEAPAADPPAPVRRRRIRSAAAKPKAPDATTVTGIGDELALVTRARAAVRNGRPREALTLRDDHRRRFPAGALAREMAVVELDALCRLGRHRKAAKVAASLEPGGDADRRVAPCERPVAE